jgi:hypothetical protein
MFFSVVRPVAIIIISAIMRALNTDLGTSVAITRDVAGLRSHSA